MRAKGFTVIELLVVILIIGILASVAIPTYIRTVEKARADEAITNLKLIYDAERIYRLENGSYSPNLANASEINNALRLDIEPRFWSYDVGSGGTTFLATATRDPSAPPPYDDDTISLDQGNTWGGDSPFVPSN